MRISAGRARPRGTQPGMTSTDVIEGVEATLDQMQSRLDELSRGVDSYLFPSAPAIEPPRAA